MRLVGGRSRDARARTRRARGRARAGARARRRARTASCPGSPGAGVTIDPVAGDLLDAPRGRAEHEGLARPALVDHLLVELAHARAVGQEHAEQAAVGDGAAVGDREALRAGAAADRAVRRGPTRRAAAARRTRRTDSGRRACRARRRARRRTARRSGAARRTSAASVVDRPLVDRAHRRRSAARARRAGCAGSASPRSRPSRMRCDDDRGLEQVAAVLREDACPRLGSPTWWPARPMRCSPRRHRARRLDLDHEVDRAHVDAELERAGRDERRAARPALSSPRSASRCSRASEPWCGAATSSSPASSLSCAARRSARRRALTKMIVRAVRADELEQARVDVRPDARRTGAGATPGRDAGSSMSCAELAPCRRPGRRPRSRAPCACRRRRSSTGRGRAGRRARPPRKRAISSSGRCVADSPMRCGGPPRVTVLEPFERERQVRAALGGGHRVDLVDDHASRRGAASRAPATSA